MANRGRKTAAAKKGYASLNGSVEYALSDEDVWFTRTYLRGSRSAWVPIEGNVKPDLTQLVSTTSAGFRLPKSDTLEPV